MRRRPSSAARPPARGECGDARLRAWRCGVRYGRLLRLVLPLAGIALTGAGCARLFSSYDLAPNGLSRRDDALRRLLSSGRADSALVRVGPDGESAPEDELLRALYSGILAHYAGAYDESNAAFERAVRLTEDRYTESISRAALSLVTNDKVIAYEPSWTERLMIPYYAALNYLARGDVSGAAVEARRLGFLLEQEAERDDEARHRPTLAFLRYFTGVVFEAAGYDNDAAVAYRNARVLADVDTLPFTAAVPDSLGEVVVVLERGFVAHRVEQAVVVPLHGFEVERITGGEEAERLAAAMAIAARVVARALAESGPRRVWRGRSPGTLHVEPTPVEARPRRCRDGEGGHDAAAGLPEKAAVPRPRAPPTVAGPRGDTADGTRWAKPARPARGGKRGERRPERRDPCDVKDEDPYLLRIAWPVFRADRVPVGTARLVGSDDVIVPVRFQTDLSEAVIRDFEQERTRLLARTVARATAKLALTRGLAGEIEEKNEALGEAVGLLFNLSTALLEQADTRSWQLLPARIGIARVQLPPGTHTLAIELDADGARPQRIPLDPVEVRSGRIAFTTVRLWR
ncbi:MAG TPA: hypothetical protein VF188_17920 [Longimicrobiales bacterium]